MLDNKVTTFLMVCQEMNYTRAAEKLHITQPAVSHHIQDLEAYYGVRLFHVKGKKISLTEEGQLLCRSLTTLHNNELYLREQLRFLSDKKRTLRFGTTRTVGEFLIAAPLSEFLKKHKDADISVTVTNTRELLKMLDDGQIDFAILEGDYSETFYAHMPYIVDDFIPICGQGYRFAGKARLLHDLTGECLLLREEGSGTRSILEQALSDHHLSFENFSHTVTIGNMHAIKDMVIAGCGITFLYKAAVHQELESGSILQIPLRDFHIRHEISIVWAKNNLFESSFQELFAELFGVQ